MLKINDLPLDLSLHDKDYLEKTSKLIPEGDLLLYRDDLDKEMYATSYDSKTDTYDGYVVELILSGSDSGTKVPFESVPREEFSLIPISTSYLFKSYKSELLIAPLFMTWL